MTAGPQGKLDAAPAAGADVTVVCLTFNEEIHLARALASVAGFATRVLVVDSFSTDRTVEIATTLGARVLQRRFVNYADQFAWALDQSIDTAWVMRLDADEVVEDDLARAIATRVPGLPDQVTGVEILYKCIFMGRWIRHGGRHPMYLLRLWRTGAGTIERRWMDEHIALRHGAVVRFDSAFRDENLKGLSFFSGKHNNYATHEAIDILCTRWLSGRKSAGGIDYRVKGQASWRRYWKAHLYNRLHPLLAPFLYFLFRYVVLLGFLDGVEGFIYHLLQGLCYRFMVGAKVVEFSRATRGETTLPGRFARLEAVTGLPDIAVFFLAHGADAD